MYGPAPKVNLTYVTLRLASHYDFERHLLTGRPNVLREMHLKAAPRGKWLQHSMIYPLRNESADQNNLRFSWWLSFVLRMGDGRTTLDLGHIQQVPHLQVGGNMTYTVYVRT